AVTIAVELLDFLLLLIRQTQSAAQTAEIILCTGSPGGHRTEKGGQHGY
ncbi:MAG: hypothetical protein H7145_03380, partial [Akkermansiaceae bacterium]|nr:hypothetical protein [Armatimonadota bacterium]